MPNDRFLVLIRPSVKDLTDGSIWRNSKGSWRISEEQINEIHDIKFIHSIGLMLLIYIYKVFWVQSLSKVNRKNFNTCSYLYAFILY